MQKRIISAIIMIILSVPFLILGGYPYLAFCTILGIASLWELTKQEKNMPKYMKWLSFIACILLIVYKSDVINYPLLVSMFIMYSFSVIINKKIEKYNYKDGLLLFGMTFLVGLMFNSLIKIRAIGLYQTIYCILVATAVDTFALFGGKLFGKNKLCADISPNKTVEGSIVGSVFGTIIGVVFYYFVIGNIQLSILIPITLVLTILAQAGDLFFSSIKRYYDIKDFSNIIPGHGGILDRLDSSLFVILGYLLYMVII